MSTVDIIWLLITCGFAALIGFAGSLPYGGAHLWAAFAALGVFAALVQGFEINWVIVLAPVAFAYGGAYIRIAKERGDI